MKNLSCAVSLFLPALLCAQVKREAPPSFEAYLAVEPGVPTPPPVEAPRLDLGLKGARDDRPGTRTAAAVAEEVRANQGRLTPIYKSWKLKGAAVDRFFGVSLTIGPDGGVRKAAAKGISDRDFKAEVEAAILQWSFSRVREAKPMTVNLKHLDFLYRKEVLLE